MGQRRKYQVIEAALADTRRLLGYKLRAEPEIHLNLKGFDCGWILDSVAWRPGLRVLDVGAGYSWLPIYLAREKHCEVWSVDDFGTWDSDPFWERSRDPAEYIRAHPEVKYVLGRLGEDRRPDLPSGYFDCIYSASALEHVPVARFADVWTHMDGLLREGGTYAPRDRHRVPHKPGRRSCPSGNALRCALSTPAEIRANTVPL